MSYNPTRPSRRELLSAAVLVLVLVALVVLIVAAEWLPRL